MTDEVSKADTHKPDYRKAMLFHSDRADQYAAERDAALTALAAERAKVARLVEALDAIADPQKLTSHGDPGVLRDFARAAITEADHE